jgi:alpha-tubulin suppressor-like RCC1 family protein
MSKHGGKVVAAAIGMLAVLAPGHAAGAADVPATSAVGWGWNAVGQVGSGSPPGSHLAPTPVAGAHLFARIAAGQTHTVALKADGTVWQWGDKDPIHYAPFPQEHDPVPVQVPGLTDVAAVAAGADVSLALRSDGTVWAWGANENGQLCDGTIVNRATPVRVALTGVTGIATSGHHSMFLRQDATVWTCGSNSRGELGDGTTTNRSTPVKVAGLSGAVGLAAGMHYSLALRSDGSVWGWGANEKGQLATGGFTPHRVTAAPLSGLSNVVSIAAGLSHALALTSGGQVRSWGENSTGQLCDGTKVDRAMPAQVPGLPAGVSEISAGRFSTAVRVAGSVYTCGRNISGQLGDGTTTDRLSPTLVPGPATYRQVAAGGSHVMALLR